jgi:hypothetical protein
MPTPKNNSEQIGIVQDKIFQALGLKLTDDEIIKVLGGKSLSLDQLIKHHTPAEIGAALIRLDSLSKMFPVKNEKLEIRVCVGTWCWGLIPRPPR